MNQVHGGDVTGYRLEYGRDPLDFSASLNPLGMPPQVARAAKAAVDNAAAYPDPEARALKTALGAKLGVAPETIILGNGSAELIYLYAQALRPRTALLPVPAFSEYERALRGAGCGVRLHTLQARQGFDLNASVLPLITENTEALFLCQPGNPTGRVIDPDLLDRVLQRCGETGTRLFLDECFVPFLSNPEKITKRGALGRCPHLFILGSFTKLYAMAGLRLGYGLCADAALLEAMAGCGQSWPVSTPAQAAGLAALDQDGYLEESLDLIETEKAWLCERLTTMGVQVLGQAANYVFFATDDPALGRKMASRGVLIRDCANFRGLGPGYYRVAVGLGADNQRLAQAMEASLGARGRGGI